MGNEIERVLEGVRQKTGLNKYKYSFLIGVNYSQYNIIGKRISKVKTILEVQKKIHEYISVEEMLKAYYSAYFSHTGLKYEISIKLGRSKESLKAFLADFRARKGLTQRDMAEHFNMALITWQNIEIGYSPKHGDFFTIHSVFSAEEKKLLMRFLIEAELADLGYSVIATIS